MFEGRAVIDRSFGLSTRHFCGSSKVGNVKPPRSEAAKRTLELWRDLPRSARLHTNIRWWTAPFEALEVEVPRSGNILEVGCGHGVFTTFLAVSSVERRVVGIDIDAEKIALAKQSVLGLRDGEANLSFDHRASGDVPLIDGGWDAIVFADVLYLLPLEARTALLAECVDALSMNGVLVVKEVDTAPKFKAQIAQFQEFLATKVLRITDGDALDFPSAAELEGLLVSDGLETRVARLDKGYFHPHCVVVGRKTQT
ncbi:MAG: methyltransferase domain-containing protein [Actinobacteria bacterium]|nr:methyltransferase domain-containing protein [Actinomycetota bacterium]